MGSAETEIDNTGLMKGLLGIFVIIIIFFFILLKPSTRTTKDRSCSGIFFTVAS